jgi:hypothetical protein
MTPDSLQLARDSSFARLVISTWAVVLGLALEGPEVFVDTAGIFKTLDISERTDKVIKALACIGWLLIVGGVACEGVFEVDVSEADGRLQELSGSRLAQLSKRADEVSGKLQQALADSKAAITNSSTARKETDLVNEQVSDATKQMGKLQAFLTPRSLTQKEAAELRDAFRPLANPDVPILVIGSQESGRYVQVWNSLIEAGFKNEQMQEWFNLPFGMAMSAPRKYLGLADEIGEVLRKAGIGPMIGAVSPALDTDPVRIIIGDIRTAPLPALGRFGEYVIARAQDSPSKKGRLGISAITKQARRGALDKRHSNGAIASPNGPHRSRNRAHIRDMMGLVACR